jgi:GNAT superfamily N-acetyltransferase
MIALRDDHGLDYAALGELYRSVGWGERAADPARLEAMVRGSRWIASAWDDGRLVGFARAISDGVTTAYVTDVMVHESVRRRGIASALVRRIMAGRDQIHFVLRAEPEHHPLYMKVGFVPAPTMLRRPRAK